MPSSVPQRTTSAFRPPPYLIGLGILIIALGFGLPQLISSFAHADLHNPAGTAQSQPEIATPKAVSSNAQMPNLWVGLVRLAVGLIVVCGLCVAIARWMSRGSNAFNGNMEVLASLAIDSRCGLHLIRAGERRMLIGADYSGVKALVELPGRALEAPASPPPDSRLPSTPVSDGSVVIGPVSVPVPAVVPEPLSNAEEIFAIIERLRSVAVATPPDKNSGRSLP